MLPPSSILLGTSEKARKKLRPAQYMSDLHTEEEHGRGKQNKFRVQLPLDSNSGSNESYVPSKPATVPGGALTNGTTAIAPSLFSEFPAVLPCTLGKLYTLQVLRGDKNQTFSLQPQPWD